MNNVSQVKAIKSWSVYSSVSIGFAIVFTDITDANKSTVRKVEFII